MTSKDKAINVSNPLNYNINLIKRLNVYHRLDQSLIKGIVVINNDSTINVTGSNNQFLIIKRNELLKYIKKFDKDDIGNLKEKDVVNFINKLDKENQRKNNG